MTATAALALDLVAVTMGVDRLERRRSASGLLDGEGLVPIFLGEDLAPTRTFADWPAAMADIERLETCAAGLEADSRGVFMRAMVRSLRAAARLFSGLPASYAETVRTLVGAPEGPVEEEIVEDLTAALSQALAAAGFGAGPLHARVVAWEADRTIEPERVQGVFRDLMTEAKARTDAMIYSTGDYDMVLNPLHDVPFTARCGFIDRRMDLNVDLAFTRAALKHLVCHEVFPGHATQLLFTRGWVLSGQAEADALLCTANAVTGCVQEGIGDQGVMLIDWIEDEDDEIHRLLRRLRSAAQTTAAWRLMVEEEPQAAVAEYLRVVACGQEPWIRGRLRMAAHPFRGPFIASYWAGDESVRRVRERTAPQDRGAFLAYLYGQAHSPESLDMFQAA